MNLIDMKQQQKAALDKANAMVTAAETANRALSASETENYDAAMAEYKSLGVTIKAREEQNTIRAAFGPTPVVDDRQRAAEPTGLNRWRVREYAEAFSAFARSRGHEVPAALALGMDELGGCKFPGQRFEAAAYETQSTSGASIYPTLVDTSTVIPLAPPPTAVERLATVIPTAMDVKFSRKTAFGTAAVKAEGTGNGANLFTGVDPQMQQVTLGAQMVGHNEDASWELLQDVQIFQSFMTEDILLSIAFLKEQYYINGNGAIAGLIGNVGAGVTGEIADGSGNLLSVSATFDVLGALNPFYAPRAAWLMAVATGVELRKAQTQANLFAPVFTTVNGQDYLHGKPIEYSAYMPAVAAGATPVLYGDFKAGYLIGNRGGSGVNVKILDQPKALEGLLTVLGYQRVGAIIRRSEAIQPIVLHT